MNEHAAIVRRRTRFHPVRDRVIASWRALVAAYAGGVFVGVLASVLVEWTVRWLDDEPWFQGPPLVGAWWAQLLIGGIAGCVAIHVAIRYATHRDRWVLATTLLTYLCFWATAGLLGFLAEAWLTDSIPYAAFLLWAPILLWSPVLGVFFGLPFSPILLPWFWACVYLVDRFAMKAVDAIESARIREARERHGAELREGRQATPVRPAPVAFRRRLWLHGARRREITSAGRFTIALLLGAIVGLLMGAALGVVQQVGRTSTPEPTAQILAGVLAGLVMAEFACANLALGTGIISTTTFTYFGAALAYGVTGAVLNAFLLGGHAASFDGIVDATLVFGFWTLAVSPVIYPLMLVYVASVEKIAMREEARTRRGRLRHGSKIGSLAERLATDPAKRTR